jgi:hypothetical protein
MRTLATARLKRARAVELVAQGKSYDEVATAVGYGHRGSAHRAVSKALIEREFQGVDELRAVELARLNRLQSAIWTEAMGGDVRAVNTVVRIIDQRTRLLGLGGGAGSGQREVAPQMLVLGPAEGNPGVATHQPHRGAPTPPHSPCCGLGVNPSRSESPTISTAITPNPMTIEEEDD